MTDLFGPLPPVISGHAAIYHADMMEVLPAFPENSFDSCVTDPPYHLTSIQQRFSRTLLSANGTNEARARARSDPAARLTRGFMGKTWDGGDIAQRPETWAQVLRVMKPGAHLIAFGGTRTEHRMKCAIEDAGFQIRDAIDYHTLEKYDPFFDGLRPDQQATLLELLHEAVGGNHLSWVFSQGLVLKSVKDGWSITLKPAHEPIVLARKPLDCATVDANFEKWGTGKLRIDDCRVGSGNARQYQSKRVKPGASQGNGQWLQDDVWYEGQSKDGRWPSNVLHDGNFDDAYPQSTGGHWPSKRGATSKIGPGTGHKGQIDLPERYDVARAVFEPRRDATKSASRFYYAAKADKADRNGSSHPTVKPINLKAYFQRLITPPGGLTLDCFAGSGTAIEAARREGLRIVAIEKEVRSFMDCVRRLK